MNGNDREKLCRYIQEVSFALLDCGLYLDTHPCDQEALEYYEKYQKLRKEALKEYQRCFGPLLLDSVNTTKGWGWTEGPWPWEGGCC